MKHRKAAASAGGQGMTLQLARQLVRWEETTPPQRIVTPEGRVLQVRSRPPAGVLDFLLSRLGHRILHFSPTTGVAIRDDLTLHEILVARLMVDGKVSAARKPARPAPDDFDPEDFMVEPSPPPERDDLPPPADHLVRWTVCSRTEVRHLLEQQNLKPERKRMLEQYERTPVRDLPRITGQHIEALDELALRFPNFSGVIQSLRRDLHLQRRLGGAVHIRPQLLLGPPGVGKTEFGRQLAGALGCGFVFHSLAEISAGFMINGLGHQWGSAAPGLIARAIADLPPGKPLMVMLDELDKVHLGSSHPPDRILLGLLESGTATQFLEEYLDLRLDVSRILFVFTANRLNSVRPELLSRMALSEVDAPSPEHMPAVVRSVDAALRAREPALDGIFEPLSDAVIDALTRLTPRQAGRALTEAYGRACEDAPAEATRLAVHPRHLPASTGEQPAVCTPDNPRDWPLLVLVNRSAARH